MAKNKAPAFDFSTGSLWKQLVAEKMESLHFGVVQIVVHNSQVIRVERSERETLSAKLFRPKASFRYSE